jgi:hypothetical protein
MAGGGCRNHAWRDQPNVIRESHPTPRSSKPVRVSSAVRIRRDTGGHAPFGGSDANPDIKKARLYRMRYPKALTHSPTCMRARRRIPDSITVRQLRRTRKI